MATLDNIKAEIQKVLDAERYSENAKAQALALFWVLEFFDKYAEQEPCDELSQECVEPTQKHVGNALKMRCDDAISREAVVDDFIEWREEIEYAFGEDYSGVHLLNVAIQKIWDMPSITPTVVKAEQEPCDDAVSRQAAIDTIESWLSCDDYNEAERHIMRAMQSVLYDLPSVRPQEQKSGKWIAQKEANGDDYFKAYDISGVMTYAAKYKCDKCGFIQTCIEDHGQYTFCPNCGARMFEPQESEE